MIELTPEELERFNSISTDMIEFLLSLEAPHVSVNIDEGSAVLMEANRVFVMSQEETH